MPPGGGPPGGGPPGGGYPPGGMPPGGGPPPGGGGWGPPPGAPPGGGYPPGGYGPPGGAPPGGYGPPGGAPPGGYGPPGGAPPGGYGPPGGMPPGGYGPPPGGYGGPPPGGYGGGFAPPPGGMVPPGGIIPAGGGASPAWTPTEAYSYAWTLVTKRFGQVAVPIVIGGLVTGLIVGVLYAIFVFVPQMLVQQGVLDSSLGGIIAGVSMSLWGVLYLGVLSYMLGGFHTVALKAVRGQPTAAGDVFSGGKYMLTCFVGLIVFEIVTGIGYLLCVVPGVILACGLWFWAFCVVDQGLGGVDALKRSWEMTKGLKMNIFVFFLLSIVVYIAGYIACVLPVLLISAPMILVASAWIYLRLKGEPIPAVT